MWNYEDNSWRKIFEVILKIDIIEGSVYVLFFRGLYLLG